MPAKITLNPSIADGKNDWYKKPVEVTITTTDSNPIHYRLVRNGRTDENEADITYTGKFTIDTLGQTAIYAWTQKGDGKSGETNETIKIDNEAPTIQNPPAITTSKELVNNWYRAGLSIEILGEDAHSGISGYYYMIKGESTEWKRRDISQKMIIGENDREGITEIAVKTVDSAGNESNEITINVQKDTKAPEFQENMTIVAVTKTGFTISARAIDRVPGSTMTGEKVTYKCYVTEVGTTNKVELNQDTTNNTGIFVATGLKENAMYDIDLIAIDPAGNESAKGGRGGPGSLGGLQPGGGNTPVEPEPTWDPNVPNPNAPTIELSGTVGNNNIYMSEVTVKITAPTGVMKFGYEVNGEQKTHEGMIQSFNVSEDGVYTIDAYTLDGSGNPTNTRNRVSFMIDKTPPTVQITVGGKTTTSISVNVSATDTSGIASYSYDYKTMDGDWIEGTETNSSSHNYTGLTKGTRYTLRVRVKDNVGNEQRGAEIVDNTVPESNPSGGSVTIRWKR